MPLTKDDVKGGLNKTRQSRPSGLIEPGNIDLHSRPTVHNRDGSISTVRSITVTHAGQAVLIPTVVGKRVVSNKAAIRHWQKTGEHLSVFTDESSADQYAQTLHEQQAKEYLPQTAMPTGPPVPLLQKHGYQGSIEDFNGRVQSVHDEYQKAYGVPPTPGLTFDLAKSPVDTAQFSKLFTVPLSQQAAKSRAAIHSQGLVAPEPVLDAKQLSSGIMEAAIHGDYHQFVTEHADIIHDLSHPLGPTKGEFFDKGDAALITGAMFKARRLAAFRDVETKVNNGEMSHLEGQQQLQAMGFLPGGAAFHALKGVGGVLALGIGQVADALIHSPAGVYELGKALGLDSRDIVIHPSLAKLEAAGEGPVGLVKNYPRTSKMGKAMAVGIKEDALHPLRNPGYLFLDILGLASAGASGVARVGEAGRVLRSGEGVGAAGRALTKRPSLQRVTVRHGELSEEMPLSQNPLVAAMQKVIIDRRQTLADARMAGDTPSGLKSFLLPQFAQDFLDTQLSFETKIGRLGDIRKGTDHIVDMGLARELDHVAGRAVTQARIQSAVPSKLRGALTRGEQKAIQVMSWDDPNPLQAERDFHQRMIDSSIRFRTWD